MSRYLRERALYDALIPDPRPEDLGLIVVIPAKNEPDLADALASLHACARPESAVEVIVVVNTSEADSAEVVDHNARIADKAREWATEFSCNGFRTHLIEEHRLPKKHAGVGLARKIGMDEACRRFEMIGNRRGVIACFDADSRCDPNYLVELEALFRRDPHCQACSVYFEHPTSGDEFSPDLYKAIIRYELHLRYFVNAQRHAGFPFASQSVGSSMAVRRDAYEEQNGMNRRQAGEDFYFLHKFTPLGRVAQLNTTRVIPSPRVSDRVPFGTGKAVGDIVERGKPLTTYAPESFRDLTAFFDSIDGLYHSDERIPDYPESIDRFLETMPHTFPEKLDEIRSGVTGAEGFRNRFFRWFNAFTIMKYLHHARDHHYPNVSVEGAARRLLEQLGETVCDSVTALDLLLRFRKLDRAR